MKRLLASALVLLPLIVFLYLTKDRPALFGNLDGYFARGAPALRSFQEPPKQTAEEADVAVEVTPAVFSSAGTDFTVRFTTHSVDLDFNLLEKAELQDDKGRPLSPLSWDGGRGGHHLSGTLKFPTFKEKTSSMKLIIKDVAGVPRRLFEWKI